MSLATGTRLGPYQIVSALGAGGMGEVYRARDSRLNRDVAIKILPASYARDPDRLQRFEQEARTVAALNHPNILALYDTGTHEGSPYLVSELLEGGTLREQLVDGPLPARKAIDYALQIAQGLAAAHEKGIVHRDLKPENIFVTKDGRVKILDFGLAKLAMKEGLAAAPVDSANMTLSPTSAGVVVGTAGYMSPEQVRGQAVDPRSDIFNFGMVLYEMLAGKRAFRGDTSVETMSAILKEDPPALPATNGQVLPAVERIVWRCLEKGPEQRFQSARDLGFALEVLAGRGSGSDALVMAPLRGSRARRWKERLPWVSGFLLIGIVSVAAIWFLRSSSVTSSPPLTRTVIDLPPGYQLAALDYPAIAISPDGTKIAYVAIHSGSRLIYLRPLDSLDATTLSDTEGANTPVFSPDGQWIEFFAGGKLKKISVNGGSAVTLAYASGTSRGSSWVNGSIVFVSAAGSNLLRISDTGGAAQVLAGGDLWPEVLPDGKAVLFSVGGTNELAAQAISSGILQGERHSLATGGTSPHYAPSGHLVFAQGDNLMAGPFDSRRLQLTGSPVPVLPGVLHSFSGGAQYGISATGSLVYVPGSAQGQERLVWVGRNGTEQPLSAPPRAYSYPRISPDGRRVAVAVGEEGIQIWIYDLARDTSTRLTFGGDLNYTSTWTPDGKRLAFMSDKEGPLNILWQPADGSGTAERLIQSEYPQFPTSFSPDGRLLAYAEVNPKTGYDLWVLRLSDHEAQPFLRTPNTETVASFSPDGRWLAYISDESGRYEVYVQPYPGAGGKYQISEGGGTEPVWNPNGKELFYRAGDKMMAVEVTTNPGFSAGKPKALFQGSYLPTTATSPYYDVSRDGQRFLMIKPSEQGSALTQIVVVQNWFEELKRRVPTGKK